MKVVLIYTLLLLAGAFLLIFVLDRVPILDWQKLDPVLETQEITTQADTVKLLQKYYQRGILTNYYDQKGVRLVLLAILLLASTAIADVHLIVDKLFYKKFYEQPNIIKATRRGLLWGLLATGLSYLALFNLLEISLVLLFGLITAGLEYLLSSLKRSV